MLWITVSSKQVDQGQSQAASDKAYKEAAKMGRQRNRSQMKEQENSTEDDLDEMEANNLTHREFRIMIIRILNSMKKT